MEPCECTPVESYPKSRDLVITVVCGGSSVVDVLRLPGSSPTARTLCNGCDEQGTRHAEEDPPVGMAGDAERAQRDCSQAEVEQLDRPRSGRNHESCPNPAPGSGAARLDGRTRASLTWHVAMDPMLASCLATELRRSKTYETLWRHTLPGNGSLANNSKRTQEGVCMKRSDAATVSIGDRPVVTVRIRIHLKEDLQCFRMEPDIRWSDRMLPLWIQRVQMEEVFSWLSTLGGAYSSLGDNMYNCAVEAGRVALRQLYLAERLGDALLQARCFLYMALSLMQQGHLAKAKRIVRQQYKFAKYGPGHSDTRLISMCLGIWHHLRHRYSKRREV